MSSSRPANEPHPSAALRRYVRAGVRSRQEVLAYLARQGCPPGRAATWVRECRQLGLVDDRAAARLWAEHWARQDYADGAIQAKLLAKGFDAPTVNASLAILHSDTDDDARARRALAGLLRRSGGRHSPSRPGTRLSARLARALASRGFDSELVERILAAVPDFHDSEIDDER